VWEKVGPLVCRRKELLTTLPNNWYRCAGCGIYIMIKLLDYLGRGGTYQYFYELKGKNTKKLLPGKVIPFKVGEQPAELPQWDNVYFPVNPVNTNPTSEHRGGKEQVEAINCMFCDYDKKDNWTEKLVKALQPEPSVIVDSGQGYHCYWLLKEPIIVTDANRESIMYTQSQWVKKMLSDDGAKDIARVLRVPGTYNNKYEAPLEVKIIKKIMQYSMIIGHKKKRMCLNGLPPHPVGQWLCLMRGKK